jgi:chromosomal replication initiator protein
MLGHLPQNPAWSDVAARLRAYVGPATYDLWLDGVEIVSWDGELLVLTTGAGTDGWIAGRYGKTIEACAQEVFGKGARVAFAHDAATRAHQALSSAGPASAGELASEINPRHTFEQFVIGDGNRLAHAAALTVAETPGQAYNPLFLHAPPGLGKTHLLHAIANYLTAYSPGTRVLYTTVEAFTNGFIAALRGEALERFKHMYRHVDVLLIDDVQFLASKVRTEEEFFHTFNALYDSGRQLVLTADRLPSQLTGIEQRLRERFASGLVAHLDPPDRRTREAILRKRAAIDHIRVTDDAVFELIADRVRDNVRLIEGALVRIVAHHSLTGQAITPELASAVLKTILPSTTTTSATATGQTGVNPLPPPVDAIQRTVAEHFNLAVSDLTGPSRTGAVAWARQLAIYLTRELTKLPLQTIGEAFGGRNHATVLHACKRVGERIAVNNSEASDLQALVDQLAFNNTDRVP